jgi:hypothetical protein
MDLAPNASIKRGTVQVVLADNNCFRLHNARTSS